MSLVHPIALIAGAGLVALPLLVHLLTRPRPVRFPFSALRFLESALRQRRFFARVRDILILALRVLLLAAIAAAFARPLLQGAAAPAGKDVTRRVVVLDVSRSMNARKGGVRVFDRAQAQALRYVKRGGDLRTNVILAGARPRAAFDTLSANYPALEAEVRRAQPLDEELDVRSALARAAQLLEAKGREDVGRGQVVVVTDLQATNWRDVSRAALPSDLDVTVEYVGLGPDAGNLTLAGVCAPERVEVGRPLRLRVDVQNSAGSEQVRTVEVAANGRVYRQDVRCAAWQSAAAFFDLPAPEAGWLTGTATIVEARDALPADDVRRFALGVGEAPTYVLISREDPRRVGTSSYFLSRMLCPSPAPEGASGARAVHVQPERLGTTAFGQAHLLVVNKPGRLGSEAAADLAGLLVRGRRVLYVVGDPADAENIVALKTACADALRLPVRFTAWTAASAAGASADAGLSLRDVQAGAPPFRVFGESIERLSSGVTAWGILKTAPEPGGAQDEVLARWSDGSAAMVDVPVGAGRLVIWNADLGRSTLPRSAFFVALVRELAEELLSAGMGPQDALPVGTSRVLQLPPEAGPAAGLAVVGPDGNVLDSADIEEGAAGVAWRWTTVGPPGVYRVKRGEQTVFAAASDCPASEGDLRPVNAEELVAQLSPAGAPPGAAPPVRVIGLPGGMARQEASEVWPWLLVAAVAFIVVELCTLKFFRV